MTELARRSLAEAIATFLLVFIGVGAIAAEGAGGGIGPLGIALAFGFVVAAMVYSVGHLSGAHLNPAVTVAFCGVKRFPWSDAPAYIVAQCVGALGAAVALNVLIGLEPSVGTTGPAGGVAVAWCVEVAITFSLMFVITSVATDDRTVPGFAGLAIGLAVAMGALAGGAFSGGSMNPARSLGPAVVTGTWAGHWIYWTAPFVGAALGAFAYEIVRTAGVSPGGESDIPRPTAEAS